MLAKLWTQRPSEFKQLGVARMVLSRSKPGSVGALLNGLLSPLIEKDQSLSEYLGTTDPSSLDGLLKIIDKPINVSEDVLSGSPMIRCPHCDEPFILRTK